MFKINYSKPNPDKPEAKSKSLKASLAKAQRTPRKSLSLDFKNK